MDKLVGLVAFELTIRARETYDMNSLDVQDSITLRAINECEHFLLGVLRRYLFLENIDAGQLVDSLLAFANADSIGPTMSAALKRSIVLMHRTSGLAAQ